MDGRGRIAEPLNWLQTALRTVTRAPARPPDRFPRRSSGRDRSRAERALRRWSSPFWSLHTRRGAGIAASALIVLGSVGFGVVRGDHLGTVGAALADMRDGAANAVGLRIASIAMSGQRQVTREEILAIAGVTGRTALPFLDVEAARRQLRTNPWIADATVLKLYPDRLQIGITEREAFALWQKDGAISVIARDGTVLEPYVARRFTRLPMVVGKGAQTEAREWLALLDGYPQVRDQVRASIYVAERRWNLRLKNGIDVRLPEAEPEKALERLTGLDRDRKLTSRDIVAIDLRRADQVVVKLSDAAYQARLEAAKDKKKKKGGAA